MGNKASASVMNARRGCIVVIVVALLQGAAAFGVVFNVNEAAVNRLEFSAPESRKDCAYLGLANHDAFHLSQIKTQILLVEIFNMYCPVCQREAPRVNELYDLIKRNRDLKEKVRFIGIGVGNTPFEVGVFKKKFGVPFPLIPDEDFSLTKISKQRIRTPTFLVLRLHAGRDAKVVRVHVGGIQDLAGFTKALQQAW
jgi:thiol-disulfide isomerase/thioredoxin